MSSKRQRKRRRRYSRALFALAGLGVWTLGVLFIAERLRDEATPPARLRFNGLDDNDARDTPRDSSLRGNADKAPDLKVNNYNDAEVHPFKDTVQVIDTHSSRDPGSQNLNDMYDESDGQQGRQGQQDQDWQPNQQQSDNYQAEGDVLVEQISGDDAQPDDIDLAQENVDVDETKEWYFLDPMIADLFAKADAERVNHVGAWHAGSDEEAMSSTESAGRGFQERQRFELLVFAAQAVRDKVNWDPMEGKSRTRPKEAVVVGTANIIQRDFQPVALAYRMMGIKVEEASKMSPAVSHGRSTGSLRTVRHRDWGVILCLSLSTDKCLSDSDFLRLENDEGSFSRVNRVAGLQEVLWSKDRYCSTIKRSGSWVPSFTFPCWVLPTENQELARYLIHNSQGHRWRPWIIKPYKQGGGKGISVLDTDSELSSLVSLGDRKVIVQPYLAQPHLLDSRKWDLRTYVLVTSVSPFARGYLYRDGLVRLATDPYNPRARHGGNKTQYLTNTSINKRKQQDMNLLTWSFARLESELGFQQFQLLFARLRRAVGMMLVAAEGRFAEYFEQLGPGFRCANCYHLLGVDLIVDANLIPRVIEVNGEPSMKMSGATSSHYDTTKSQMQQEVARIALKARRGLPMRTAQRLVDRCAVSDAEARILARDEDMLIYLMNLDRESGSATNFHLVYPDPDACGQGPRARLWDTYIHAIASQEPRSYQDRRKTLHSFASRFVCS